MGWSREARLAAVRVDEDEERRPDAERPPREERAAAFADAEDRDLSL